MNQLVVYQDSSVTNTSISNIFIDMYMKDANDAQLKIYLYLIRSINANLEISISGLADKFNHTEKDVIRSLQYWEKNGLLSLDYDDERSIVGIHLHTVPSPEERETKAPAMIVPLTPVSTVESTPLPTVPVKPTYSADDLKEYKDCEEFRLLLCVTEQYIGKPLSPADVRTMIYIYKELKFSPDLIDILLQYCVEQKKKEMRYIEKVAMGWFEQGITTPKQALFGVSKYDNNVYSIMKALGKSSTPTSTEIDYINRWTSVYAFSPEIILAACGRTVLATDTHRFEYTEGILANWKKEKVVNLEDLDVLDSIHKKNRAVAPAKCTTDNKFNQFDKTKYDFSELERDLLSN